MANELWLKGQFSRGLSYHEITCVSCFAFILPYLSVFDGGMKVLIHSSSNLNKIVLEP